MVTIIRIWILYIVILYICSNDFFTFFIIISIQNIFYFKDDEEYIEMMKNIERIYRYANDSRLNNENIFNFSIYVFYKIKKI